MSDITQAFAIAFALLRDLDPELIGIVALSLRVSLSATAIAMVLAAPLGALLAVLMLAIARTDGDADGRQAASPDPARPRLWRR